MTGCDPFSDGTVVGQVFDLAVEQAAALEIAHHPVEFANAGYAVGFGDRYGQRLQVVVAQHQFGHLIRHRGKQGVALGPGQPVFAHGVCQGDLDVDFDVGGVDAGGIVDRIGVAAAAIQRIGDAAFLGESQIGAFADHLGANLPGLDADCVIGTVTDIGVVFAGILDVGADTAKPQEIRLHRQDCGHDVLWRGLAGLKPDHGCRLRRQVHRFQRPRNDHAALRQLGLVIVLPAGAAQVEQTAALGKSNGAVGVRINEDIAVIKSRQQLDLRRQQHAVAEHVT